MTYTGTDGTLSYEDWAELKAKEQDDSSEEDIPSDFDTQSDKNNNAVLELESKDSNITDEDKKAIYDYMSSKSYIINEKLRLEEDLTDEDKEFIDNLDQALEKMPTYEGDITRSLYFESMEQADEFVNKYDLGKEFEFMEYISTTKGDIYNPEGKVQINFVDTKSGRDISEINKKEQEVLYQRGQKFETIDKIFENDVYYLVMKEVK